MLISIILMCFITLLFVLIHEVFEHHLGYEDRELDLIRTRYE